MSRFRPLRGRLWGVSHTPLRPGTCEGSKNGSVYATVGGIWWGVCDTPLRQDTCDPSKYRCNSPTGYVLPFKKLSCFRPLRGRGVGIFNTPLQSGMCDSSKYRCDSPTGYVRFFKIPMRSPNWVRVRVQKMDLYTPPSVAYGGAYSIRPYDRVRAILRNTDAIPQSGTYGTSKNRPVFVPFGAVYEAYSIRPYN